MRSQQLCLIGGAVVLAAACGGIGGRFLVPRDLNFESKDGSLVGELVSRSGRHHSSASSQPFLPLHSDRRAEPEADVSPPDIAFFPESVAKGGVAGPTSASESEEQKSIWHASLADLPPEQAHEIHMLRTRLGSIAAQSLGLTNLTPLESEPQLIDIPKDGSMKRAESRRTASEDEVRSAIAQVVAESREHHQAVEQVRSVQGRNGEQKSLPGFKRTELFVIHRDVANGETRESASSLSIWSERLDLAPGRLRPTGNPFDVAIEGAGWLCVELSPEERALTRNGQLTLSSERHLSVRTPRGVLPIIPAIKVPATAARVEIWPDGRCLAWTQPSAGNAAALHECGQLLIANCLDAARLKPLGDGLYEPTDASGEIWKGEPGKYGLGSLKSQTLEESNEVTKLANH